MRAIDRVRTIQSIVAEMERIMSIEDVYIFFNALNIETPLDDEGYPVGGSINWLIRNHLDNCTDANLLDIADQLDLTLTISSSKIAQLGESKYWLAGHFRVFISHVHSVKVSAALLKQSLQKYGITCFVAHEDIETSDEWRDEILRCLISMDALVAILSEGFNSSKWTDQEVGAAVCRDTLIIPINKGVQPYGFIEKYQSFNASDKQVKDVVKKVFQTIANASKTKEPMAECLAKLISTGSDISTAIFRMEQLHSIEGLSNHHWKSIRNNIAAHPTLSNSQRLVEKLNTLLAGKNIELVTLGGEKQKSSYDYDIPF